MAVPTSSLPWAVHISDGALSLPWLLGGFGLAGLLALWGGWRVKDEEIPRIALLSAAFFVTSLLHLRVPPTSVHLLLNGLIGVLLGRRAALAILLGLFLQAVLLGHGGFTTLGVNACILTLPALLAGEFFRLLHRGHWLRRSWVRVILTGVGALTASLGAVFLVALIASNRGGRLQVLDTGWAWHAMFHPISLAAAWSLALMAAWSQRRWCAPAEFVLGLLTGGMAVLLTVVLASLVLLLGGGEDWHTVVAIVVVAHLPLAVVEGIVAGYIVSFLARVQPNLLGLTEDIVAQQASIAPQAAALGPPAVLLALLSLASLTTPAQAHRLRADWQLLAPGKLQVEGYFDITGDPSVAAQVTVYAGQQIVAQGQADERGRFVFDHDGPGPLRVVLAAGGGHRAEIVIPTGAFAVSRSPSESGEPDEPLPSGRAAPSPVSHPEGPPSRDVLLGVTFVLALAAFVLSIRNARRLRDRE